MTAESVIPRRRNELGATGCTGTWSAPALFPKSTAWKGYVSCARQNSELYVYPPASMTSWRAGFHFAEGEANAFGGRPCDESALLALSKFFSVFFRSTNV